MMNKKRLFELKEKSACFIGFHDIRPVDFGNMNYKDEKHGYIEQDYCINCGYKSEIRTFY